MMMSLQETNDVEKFIVKSAIDMPIFVIFTVVSIMYMRLYRKYNFNVSLHCTVQCTLHCSTLYSTLYSTLTLKYTVQYIVQYSVLSVTIASWQKQHCV